MSAYPVEFVADYASQRSRLTTFFRMILAIPHSIVSIVYGIGAFVALVIAWFALVITGRYPEALYDFVAGVLRFNGRFYSYYYFLTDAFPPFGLEPDSAYPVRVDIAPRQESYNRLTVFLRAILAIPVLIAQYVANLVLGIVSLVDWVAIVISGRQPRALQDVVAYAVGFYVWSSGYTLLLTDRYPPFLPPSGELSGASSGALPSGGPTERLASTASAPGTVAPERPSGAAPPSPPSAAEGWDPPAPPEGDRPEDSGPAPGGPPPPR